MDMNWLTACDGGVVLKIKATPRAVRSAIVGVEADRLRVRLRAPPVDGQANEALVELLAETLDVPRRAVTLVSGAGARCKRVRVVGVAIDKVRRRLVGVSPENNK
jgi:uncharacterized protein (TIGR00251 family)